MASTVQDKRNAGIKRFNKEIRQIMAISGVDRAEAIEMRKADKNGATEKHLEAKTPKGEKAKRYKIKTKLGPLLSPPKQTIEELMVTVKTRCGELADAIERHRNNLEQTQRELHQWTAVGRALGMEVGDTIPEKD